MRRIVLAAIAVCVLVALPIYAGEYHAGNNLLCYDCHTAHFSMQHGWDSSTTPTPGVASLNGNWLGSTGPNLHLLKAPGSEVCIACHDGQTFAPDVMATDTNSGATVEGRSAGGLNEAGSPYAAWTGHTIGNIGLPPGYNAAVGGTLTGLTSTYELECVSCHIQHGIAESYRNLGSRSLTNTQPTFTVSTTQKDPCYNPNAKTLPTQANGCDVWVNITQASYTPGSGNSANFGPYYDTNNVFYNRNDVAASGTTPAYSNRMDAFCGMCHSAFHGGPDGLSSDLNSAPNSWTAGMGGTAVASGANLWLRHPTGITPIGGAGTGGNSAVSNYNKAKTRVKVYATTQPGVDTGAITITNTQATPGCVSCHKAHGNQNPFGLIFMASQSTATTPNPITENGVWAAADVQNPGIGQRNLCGQCHSQGNH